MKGKKTGRLEAPKTLISRSIRNRNINGLLWAFITLAHEEIKVQGQIETFSGSDIRDFVKLLHAREIESKLQDDATAAISTRQLQQWIDASTAKESNVAKAASKATKSKWCMCSIRFPFVACAASHIHGGHMLQGQQYLGSVKGGLFEWYLKKRPLCFVGFAAISSVANRSGCYVYSMNPFML